MKTINDFFNDLQVKDTSIKNNNFYKPQIISKIIKGSHLENTDNILTLEDSIESILQNREKLNDVKEILHEDGKLFSHPDFVDNEITCISEMLKKYSELPDSTSSKDINCEMRKIHKNYLEKLGIRSSI